MLVETLKLVRYLGVNLGTQRKGMLKNKRKNVELKK